MKKFNTLKRALMLMFCFVLVLASFYSMRKQAEKTMMEQKFKQRISMPATLKSLSR